VLLIGVGTADLTLRRAYQHWKPQLQQSLGALLGHPVVLGPYQGLGWGGLQVGPSRVGPGLVGPGPGDASSATVGSVALSLDPLASLRQGLPVLQVSLAGVRVDLRRNPQGQYWVLPPSRSKPRLDLRIRLVDPALVIISPAGQSLRMTGGVSIRPDLSRLQLSSRLRPPEGSGALALDLTGQWDRKRWQARLRSQAVPLQVVQRFLAVPGPWSGAADGTIQLEWTPGALSCRGGLQLSQWRWRPVRSTSTLELPSSSLRCQGQTLELAQSRWRWLQPGSPRLEGTVALAGSWSRSAFSLRQLQLQRGGSWLRLRGQLDRRLDLSGTWRLRPGDLPLQSGSPAWLRDQVVTGSLTANGVWSRPLLEARLGQASNPLLGPWTALLRWRDQRLELDHLRSAYLSASGVLPFAAQGGQGLRPGSLDLRLDLNRYPLSRLNLLVGAPLQGVLQASGSLRGPLSAITPNLDLWLDQPAAGPVALRESWQGHWFGDPAGGGRLRMEALAPAPVGALQAHFDRRWVPQQIRLERNNGTLTLTGRPQAYRWQATALPLDGLELAMGPKGRRQSLQGRLSGSGDLSFKPLGFSGTAQLERPVFLGVWARSLQASFRYRDRRYQARGTVTTQGGGELAIDWSGLWNGAFRSRLEARQLPARFLRQLVEAWPQWRGEGEAIVGRASDIGTLLIDNLGGSLQDQLAALEVARARVLAERRELESRRSPLQRLQDLDGRVDGELQLAGPTLLQAHADLQARLLLWRSGEDQDSPLTQVPVLVRFDGPLRQGSGDFILANLPLELLSLLTPVPASLRGSLSARGRYSLGRSGPQLSLNLALADASLQDTSLALERGSIQLENGRLVLDLALRAAGAASSVDLAGVVPLNPDQDGVELRLASRDDGLRFLAGLAEPGLTWKGGSGDLQLLVRGSVAEPIANGFLRFRGVELAFVGQRVRDVEATLLFDFEQLLLQEFTAKVGEKGTLSAKGSLGLLRPTRTADGQASSLAVEVKAVPFALPRIKAVADGQLRIGGSLPALNIGGNLAIARGNVNVQPGRLASEDGAARPAATPAALLESRWSFEQPLVLLGPEVESNASETLRESVPLVPAVGFDDLRLSLGPDLTVGVPNLASFSTSGQLRINGRLDPSLRLQGVVRLLRGRFNFFTTTFGLDPDSPNVAVFTPSLGLIPYLDIALRTRVSDSLPVNSGLGPAGSLSLQDYQAAGATDSLDQLNLVRVSLSVSGPADRLADNLVLRSSPPLSQDRLLALIGGNTLAAVGGAAGGTVLATALGQTLLSPVLGTLSDAFGQRLSFALYPTYVNQNVSSAPERRSGRVPPQLVLGAEIGLDISERFNASVLAAPNRSDVPPQLNLNYKASELLNLQGSIDAQGAWQTQLQLFFRF